MDTVLRDWTIIPLNHALGKQFGYDIYPIEFKKISGDLSLVMLSKRDLDNLQQEEQKLAPLITRGARIDEKMLRTFAAKKCSVIPVLVPGTPEPLKKLTAFAVKHTNLLSGRVYSCVEDWLQYIRKDRAVSVVQAVKKFRTPLLQSLNNALKDWEGTIVTLVNDVLASDENLSILSIFDDYIGSLKKKKEQKEHGVEIAILSLMIARRCHLKPEQIHDLGLASLLHDMGIIFYEEQLKDMIIHNHGEILDPDTVKELYDIHPFFSAILLTKKNGEPISGINTRIRDMILEHEQKIDGSGPHFWSKDYKEELASLKIFHDTVYRGNNSLSVDPSIPDEVIYPDGDYVKKKLSIPSQILHISERYVTLLSKYQKKELSEPHKLVITEMLEEAGRKINGTIFEIFFNYLIPNQYYPDNMLVTILTKDTDKNVNIAKFNDYTAVILTKKDESGQELKLLRVVRDPYGNDMKSNVVFNLDKIKKDAYLKIDEWSKTSS